MGAKVRGTASQARSGGVRAIMAAACIFAAASSAPGLAVAQAPIEPVAPPWSFAPPLDNKKEAENVSGAVCAPPGAAADPARRCLLVSDEVSGKGKRYVRFFAVEGTTRTLRLGPTLELLPNGIEGEADVEGADFDGGRFHVVGSHALSVGRNEPPEYQPSRIFVYRIGPDARGAGQVERGCLEALLAGLPEGIGRHACTAQRWKRRACVTLQRHGVDIEGLAVRDGRLYLGLRAPVLDGRAFVAGVPVDAAFGSGEARPEVFPLALGAGVGIRDIARVQGGFLVLTGPELPEAKDQPGSARVFFWREGEEARDLGPLGGMRRDEKPEALLVLGDDAEGYRVLVLSDGTDKAAGGRPTEYRVRK